jgi:N-acetylglucosamine malate deacetylase 2
MKIENMGRVLVFVAHPDDETIGCSGLLQRACTSLVVFAVDGAPPHYGFERKFGSLRKYSEARFEEASRALSVIPSCSFRRLQRRNGGYFLDQHLFEDLHEAFLALLQIAREFSAEVIVSHAYEGGHIDHDACSFLATLVARALGMKHLEFPLYWKSASGQDIFQRFRRDREGEFVLELTAQEFAVKQQMRKEYKTQQEILQVFGAEAERFRPTVCDDYTKSDWQDYAFENRRRRLSAELFFKRVAEFGGDTSTQKRRERQAKRFWRRWGRAEI